MPYGQKPNWMPFHLANTLYGASQYLPEMIQYPLHWGRPRLMDLSSTGRAATIGTGSEGRYRESEATLLEVVLFLMIIMTYHTMAKI